MARAKTRRASRRTAASSFPRLRRLIRPELLGTLLVVVAVATLPYLLPLTAVLRSARDELVGALGLHVFSGVAAVAALGVVLALRKSEWLIRRRRHIAGAALLLLFSAGLLSLWRPDTRIGSVDLGETSAGGDLGRLLTGGWPLGLAWLATLPAAFALLWPRTAARLLRATPGEIARDGIWLWRHGPRQTAAGLAARLRRYGDPGMPQPEAHDPFFELRAPLPENLAAPVDANGDAGAEEIRPEEDEDDGRAAVQIPMDLEHEAGEWRHSSDGWQLPPIELLRENVPAPAGLRDNKQRAELIVETLASFGVEVSVAEINDGPTVTQFGLEPGWDVRTRTVVERDAGGDPLLDEEGQPRTKQVEISRTRIRVNRITSLQNDLALALAAPALRIEAPVPGKSVIGIEVPNSQTSIVTLRGVLESRAFSKQAGLAPLPIALGAGVSGTPGRRGPRGDAAPADRGRDGGRQVGLPQLDHHLPAHELFAAAIAARARRPEARRAVGVRRHPAPRLQPHRRRHGQGRRDTAGGDPRDGVPLPGVRQARGAQHRGLQRAQREPPPPLLGGGDRRARRPHAGRALPGSSTSSCASRSWRERRAFTSSSRRSDRPSTS